MLGSKAEFLNYCEWSKFFSYYLAPGKPGGPDMPILPGLPFSPGIPSFPETPGIPGSPKFYNIVKYFPIPVFD
jgi:hypothetical protein